MMFKILYAVLFINCSSSTVAEKNPTQTGTSSSSATSSPVTSPPPSDTFSLTDSSSPTTSSSVTSPPHTLSPVTSPPTTSSPVSSPPATFSPSDTFSPTDSPTLSLITSSPSTTLTNATSTFLPTGSPNSSLTESPTSSSTDSPTSSPITTSPTEAPTNGGAGGDPHIFTFFKKWLSYHGACDLVLAKTTLRESQEELAVHIRTTIHKTFSYISEVSVKIGSNVFQVIGNERVQENCKDSKLMYALNGVKNKKLPVKFSSYTIEASKEIDKDDYFGCSEASVFTIKLNQKEKIKISFLRGFLYVNVAATSYNFGVASGLMGTWGKEGFIGRDGKALFEDVVAYAQEWQVRGDEPFLFQERKHPQFPMKCLPPPTTDKSERRRLGAESTLRSIAEKACSKIGDAMPKDICIFDVMATGDVKLATSELFGVDN